MKKRGKKGDVAPQALFFLFEVLLVLVVLVGLLSRVDSIRKSTDFEKAYLARDNAFIINTLSALPGNTYYTYSPPGLELKKFDFSFKNNLVEVTEAEQKAAESKYFPYAENGLLAIKSLGSISAEERIYFLKSGISLTTEKNSNLDKIYFVPADYDTPNQRILIYPPDGQNDEQTNIIFTIANITNSNIKYDLVRLTRDAKNIPDDPRLRNSLISTFDPYAIITITIGSYNSDKNYVKAYYNIKNPKKEEAKQLAAYILNEISDDMNRYGNISGIAIIPVDPDKLPTNSPILILKNDGISLILEIGNIQSNLGKKMLTDNISKIGYSIAKGIKNHFK